jgi:hypothetical protein
MFAVVCRTILMTGHLICGHQMPEEEAITAAFKFAQVAQSQMSTPFVIREHDAEWPDALVAAAATEAQKADAANLKTDNVHLRD